MSSRVRAGAAGLLLLGLLGGCVPAAPRPLAPLPPADTLAATAFGLAFADARALAVDPAGRLYVADAGRDVVLQLDPHGTVQVAIGGPGTGDHAFLAPAGVDPTNGLVLFVADAGNGRIVRLGRARQVLDARAVPADAEAILAGRPASGRLGRPVAVASAPTGELFAVDAQAGVVLRWDARGALDRVIGGAEAGRGALRAPVALALAPDGRLLVADQGHAAVLVYDAFGAFVRRLADGLARDVRFVSVDRDGGLLVTLPDRLLAYDPQGALAAVFTAVVPEALVAAVRSEHGIVALTPERLYRLERHAP